jgi:hypothetical protein
MRGSVLGLEDDAVWLVGCTALLLLLLLELLRMGLVVLLGVRVLVRVSGEGAQTGQPGRVGLRSWRKCRLRVRVLGMRGGGIAVHQTVGLSDLVRSIKLLRGESRWLLTLHGVDGRTHGLVVTVNVGNGGGTPALGRLCDRGQRALSHRICGFRSAVGARALARAWLGLRLSSGRT